MSDTDGEPDDAAAEPWQPPMWPRYAGLAAMAVILAAVLAFGAISFRAIGDDDADGGQAFFGLVLAVTGTWYMSGQIRTAWRRLQEARASERAE